MLRFALTLAGYALVAAVIVGLVWLGVALAMLVVQLAPLLRGLTPR